jgi:membrane protein YdbS with pleckstrin-like domain
MHKFNPNPVVAAVGYFIIAIVLNIALFFFRSFVGNLLPAVVGLIWLFTVIKIVMRYTHAKFELVSLDEKSMKYTKGIFFQHNIILPYVKITEATYFQTPLQRLFGVGTLKIDSAGGSTVAIFVYDVNKSDIELILQEVNEKAGNDGGV